MGDKLRFNKHDDGDEYEPTDSEDNYSEEEKELLKEVRNSRKRDVESKKELMAFDEDDSGEDDEDDDDEGNNDLRDSDIEGAENDDRDLPNTMDWGSKSRNYYNTDFVDQDYSTYNEQEEEMAQQEEEEAKMIQMRLAKQMKESDFLLDEDIIKTVEKTSDGADSSFAKGSSKIKADFKSLSQSERQRLFQNDSPEFTGLISDFQDYMNENEELFAPILSYVRANKMPMIPALEFTQTYQNLSLSYCSNISFYLLLKAKRIPVRNHPIVKRMLQIKKLLQQLKDKYDNVIRPQLEALLERIVDGDEFEILETKPKADKPKKKTKLSILDQFGGAASKSTLLDAAASSDDDDDKMGEEEQGEDDDADAEGALERRGITYQIAKNKGLMPARKKEQRNPRVKHRSKFRKALIRRKGAVRTVRTETKRYGGEMSGIKATVSKSIKFRS